jgi:hypothetical protein
MIGVVLIVEGPWMKGIGENGWKGKGDDDSGRVCQ